jgi:hypothetical protein
VLLSITLLILVSVGSAFGLLQDRMHVMSVCRIESLKTQSEVEPLIKRLFDLNPQARLLRNLMLAAKAKLATAILHLNAPMAALARQEIAMLRKQQSLLDQTQKFLIQTANIKLHQGTFITYMKLKEAFEEIKMKGSGWAQIQFQLQNPKIPKLAVKPEDRSLAPVYLAQDDFEKRQVTSQFWTQEYKIKGILNTTHRSQSQCHATLEENTWIPKIRKDRLYLK